MKQAFNLQYLISRQFLFSVNLQKWSYYYIGFSFAAQGPDLNLYQLARITIRLHKVNRPSVT